MRVGADMSKACKVFQSNIGIGMGIDASKPTRMCYLVLSALRGLLGSIARRCCSVRAARANKHACPQTRVLAQCSLQLLCATHTSPP